MTSSTLTPLAPSPRRDHRRGYAATACPPDDDPRWQALALRDPKADGQFVYAVVTTGVYCRPSCGARRARRENVRFFADGGEAAAAGFRPCKRCTPERPARAEEQLATVAQLCRMIAASEHTPTLAELARIAKLSAFHVHRLFKAHTGVTPRAYAAAERARRLQRELTVAGSVTEAAYAAGFSSSGRFYESARRHLGMTPSEYRAGAFAKEIRFALGECSLGSLLVAATERGVCCLLLGDEPEALVHDLARRFPRARLVGDDPEFETWVGRAVALIEQPERAARLPLDVQGTAFQQRVWQALTRIPPGSTRSYAELAAAVGRPSAARAVARACASNPVAVAIPCHRVVRRDGDLCGYRWGIERKRALLARERGR